jgi:ABC-type proline/glycine betaine transport system ATPase subunit
MIVFENVHKTYKKRDHVFADLSLSVLPGDFVIMSGAPGSGKTTFLKMILREGTLGSRVLGFIKRWARRSSSRAR